MPILIAIHHLDGIIHIRRNAFDERDLVLNGDSIRHHQSLRIVRAGADAVYRAASCLNPDKIIPEIVQLLLDAGLPRFPDSNDAYDCHNTYRDSQDSQNAAHLISEERNESGLEKSCVVHTISLERNSRAAQDRVTLKMIEFRCILPILIICIIS